MNQKNKLTLLLAIPAIAAIALMPLATSDVFAQDTDNSNVRIRPAAAEKITSADSDQMMAQVKFQGETDGWAIVAGQAYKSTIDLKGNAVHHARGAWKVTSNAEISVGERHATLDLTGRATRGFLGLQGTGTLDSGEPFRIILRGHFAPVHDSPGDFVVAFTAAKIQTTNDGARIPLVQYGIVHVEPVDPASADYAMFLDDLSVAE